MPHRATVPRDFSQAEAKTNIRMVAEGLRNQPGFLTTAFIADWLGVSRRTVCLWAECGEIPGLKIGKCRRFHSEVIVRWLQARQKGNSQ